MEIEDRKGQRNSGGGTQRPPAGSQMTMPMIDAGFYDDDEYVLDGMGDIDDILAGEDYDDFEDLDDEDEFGNDFEGDFGEDFEEYADDAPDGSPIAPTPMPADANRGNPQAAVAPSPRPRQGVERGFTDDDEALLEADLAEAEAAGGKSPIRGAGGSRPAPPKQPSRQDPSPRASTGVPKPATQGVTAPSRDASPMGVTSRRAKGSPTPTKTDAQGDKGNMEHEETEQLRVPRWVVSMSSKLDGNVAHAFLLEGNVRDYMVRNISIKDGIIRTLDHGQGTFEVVASYDQAHGLTFDTYTLGGSVDPAEYRSRFLELMNIAQDMLGIDRTADVPKDPVALFSIISKIMDMPAEEWGDGKERAKLLLFLDYPEMLVPQTQGSPRESERQLAIIINDMCRSELADQGGSCIVMITDDVSSISERVRSTSSRVDRVNVPMPLLDERKDFIYHVLAIEENKLSDGRKIFECKDGIDEAYLAVNTAGLARFQIEDIVLRALADDTPITPALVKERKNEIIMTDYNEIIEIMEPTYGFAEIGGMQQIKDFFMREVIGPIHRGELEGVPMGVLLMGPPGTAKCVDNAQIIPTPNGMRKVGDIKAGDYLFGDDGKPTCVRVVAPQGEREAYEVKTRDGRSVICSADHIWHVGRKAHGRIKWEDMTVQEMLERGVYSPDKSGSRPNRSKFFLPTNACCEYPERQLDIPPYVLGAFLGDGCKDAFDALTLSGKDEEIIAEVAKQLGCLYQHKPANKKTGEYQDYDWYFYHILPTDEHPGQKVHGREFGADGSRLLTQTYAHDKSIPEEYKTSSREQRLELLRGLMDTDGSIRRAEGRYNVSFATCSEQLAKDVAEVVHSLGWCANIKYQARKGEPTPNKNYPDRQYFRQHDMWEVSFLMPKEERHLVFKLSRKRDIALEACDVHPAKTTRDYSRIPIASITPLHEKREMTCFYVDNESHLFLVGDYLVTHNTLLSKAVAKESNMNCVNLNLNRILNKYVGESEHNLDRALDCAMAMEPTIIFIDEIDEALPRRNGADQSGVSQRINKRLLEFFSDTTHRGQVMILAATNYPEKIDPAFKRAGRFDNRLPMFAPGRYDRARIFHISAAKARYTISSFSSPDRMIPNPFLYALKSWLEQGNQPMLSEAVYDMTEYEYTVSLSDSREPIEMKIPVPRRLIPIITATEISLEDFYRTCDMLLGNSLPKRGAYEAGSRILTDEEYQSELTRALANSNIIRQDPRVLRRATNWLIYRDMFFTPFGDLTVGKTGAELDVVVSKCISLYRIWKSDHPDGVERLIQEKKITGPRDIPWFIVQEACKKTTAAVSGIKSMEDYALIDTSDTDYIPDEEYGRTTSNRTISYRERQEQLLQRLKSAVDRQNTDIFD